MGPRWLIPALNGSRHPGAEPSSRSDGQKKPEELGEDGIGHIRALSPRFLTMTLTMIMMIMMMIMMMIVMIMIMIMVMTMIMMMMMMVVVMGGMT